MSEIRKKIYYSYNNCKNRCKYKTCKDYKNYWGRGIRVERKTFKEFYRDMWPSYKEWLRLDRIDTNGNYCKENCKRSTPIEQENNRRNNNYIEHNWLKMTIPEWARKLWIKRSTLSQRYHAYKRSIEKTLSTN